LHTIFSFSFPFPLFSTLLCLFQYESNPKIQNLLNQTGSKRSHLFLAWGSFDVAPSGAAPEAHGLATAPEPSLSSYDAVGGAPTQVAARPRELARLYSCRHERVGPSCSWGAARSTGCRWTYSSGCQRQVAYASKCRCSWRSATGQGADATRA
jgi:hypothetical protein